MYYKFCRVKEELRVLPDQRERKETKVHSEIVGQLVVMDSLDCLYIFSDHKKIKSLQ